MSLRRSINGNALSFRTRASAAGESEVEAPSLRDIPKHIAEEAAAARQELETAVIRRYAVRFKDRALEQEFLLSNFDSWLKLFKIVVVVNFVLTALYAWWAWEEVVVFPVIGLVAAVAQLATLVGLRFQYFLEHVFVPHAVFFGGITYMWSASIVTAGTVEILLTNPMNTTLGEIEADAASLYVAVHALGTFCPFVAHQHVMLVMPVMLVCNLAARFTTDELHVSGQATFVDTLWHVCSAFIFFSISFQKNYSQRLVFLVMRRLRREKIDVRLAMDQSKGGPVNALFQWMSRSRDEDGDADAERARLPWAVDPKTIEWGEFVGRGAYGEVYRCNWKGTSVAVKKLEGGTDDRVSKLASEIALLSELRHPNIVLFMGLAIEPPYFHIITEFMSQGSLFDLLHERGLGAQQDMIYNILMQAAQGLHYLHLSDVLHHDVKSGNILVDDRFHVKISDFGLALVKGEHEVDANLGTVVYAAPEILSGDPYTEASDTYSFGIVIYETVVQKLPYYADLENGVQQLGLGFKVKNGYRPAFPEGTNSDIVALAGRCWHQEPAERPSMKEISTALQGLDKSRPAHPAGVLRVSSITSGGRQSVSSSGRPGQPLAFALCHVCNAGELWARSPTGMYNAVIEYMNVTRRLAGKFDAEEVSLEGEVFLFAFQDPSAAIKWALELQVALLDAAWPPEIMELDACQVELAHMSSRQLAQATSSARLLPGQLSADLIDGRASALSTGSGAANAVVLYRGLRVGVGIHLGQPLISVDNMLGRVEYHGPVVQTTAAVGKMSRGGEILVTPDVYEQASQSMEDPPLPQLAVVRHEAGPPGGTTLIKDSLWQLVPTSLGDRTWDHVAQRAIAGEHLSSTSPTMLGGIDTVEIRYDDIVFGERVGVGTFGEVFAATLDNRKVAVKQLLRKKLPESAMLMFYEECNILKRLKHPNIVTMIGACLARPRLCLVLEFLDRSLRDVLDIETLSLSQQISIGHDIARGMAFIHEQGLLHRDLKSANVMLDDANCAKLVDFGLARVRMENATMSRCGTASYAAPEVLRGERYGLSADVYSFGVVLWEVFSQRLPHKSLDVTEIVQQVLRGMRPTVPPRTPSWINTLMKRSWAATPDARPTFAEIVAKFVATGTRSDAIDGSREILAG